MGLSSEKKRRDQVTPEFFPLNPPTTEIREVIRTPLNSECVHSNMISNPNPRKREVTFGDAKKSPQGIFKPLKKMGGAIKTFFSSGNKENRKSEANIDAKPENPLNQSQTTSVSKTKELRKGVLFNPDEVMDLPMNETKKNFYLKKQTPFPSDGKFHNFSLQDRDHADLFSKASQSAMSQDKIIPLVRKSRRKREVLSARK